MHDSNLGNIGNIRVFRVKIQFFKFENGCFEKMNILSNYLSADNLYTDNIHMVIT